MGHIQKFNQLASHYDSEKNIHMAKHATAAIRQYIDDDYSKTMADIGCGTGLIGLELLDHFSTVYFVDGSESMLGEVKRKLAAANIKNAEVLQLDLEDQVNLPYKVDTIILSLVLHHIPNRQPMIKKIYDNLTENGQLLIIEMAAQQNHHGISKEALIADVEGVGFHSVQTETFYNMGHDNRFILSARK